MQTASEVAEGRRLYSVLDPMGTEKGYLRRTSRSVILTLTGNER